MFNNLVTNQHPTQSSTIAYNSIRILGLYLIFSNFAIIPSFIFIVLLNIIFYYCVYFIYKHELLNPVDKCFVNKDIKKSLIIGGYSIVENFNKEKIILAMKQRFFYKIPKLLASLRVIFGDYCWNTPLIPLLSNEEKEKIINRRIIHKEIYEKDLLVHITEVLNERINCFDTPFEFHLISFKDNHNKGAVYFKSDHTFIDGLGSIALFGYLDDEFDFEKYPMILRRQFSRYERIIYLIKDTFLSLTIGLVQNIIQVIKYYIDIYKNQNLLSKGMRKANSQIVNFSISKYYSISSIKSVSKVNEMSINEYLSSVILSAFKRILKNKTELLTAIPVGFTSFPKTIEDIELYNSASSVFKKLSLNDYDANPEKNYILKQEIRSMVKNSFMARSNKFLLYYMSLFFTTSFNKMIADIFTMETVISNVPRQEKHMYIGGGKVIELVPVVNNGINNSFVNISSYSGSIIVTASVDQSQDFTSHDLIKEISKILDSKINQ